MSEKKIVNEMAAVRTTYDSSGKVVSIVDVPDHVFLFLLVVDSIIMTKWQGPELKPLYEQLISDCDLILNDDDLNGFVGHLKGERTPYSTIARHIKTYGFYSWRWQHKAGDYSRAVIHKTYIDVKGAYNL